MKKIYFIFALSLLIISCKNDGKSTDKANETDTKELPKTGTQQQSNIKTTRTVGDLKETFSGMFLYLESEKAAVLQTGSGGIYGVVIDDQMLALNEQCKQYKTKDEDMVPVVIRGAKKPNPVPNAWKEVIEIEEILSVQKPSGQDGTIIIKNNQ